MNSGEAPSSAVSVSPWQFPWMMHNFFDDSMTRSLTHPASEENT